MFKKIMNSMMAIGMSFVMASSYWDIVEYGNSLLLFGEPTFPSQN